ncbi:MAG TPA: hypothetical protein VG369_00720 [Humibacter sp.]|nr:hypothetical protein [Humibacter sp.]
MAAARLPSAHRPAPTDADRGGGGTTRRRVAPFAALGVFAVLATAGLGATVPAHADASAPSDTIVVSQTASDADGPDALSLGTYTADTGDSTAPAVTFSSTGSDAFTMSGSSNAGGFISTAADESGVTLGGFQIAADPSSGADPKDDPTVPRRVGWIDDSGTVSTIGLGAAMSGGIRSVATPDGTSFYAAGNDASAGVQLVTPTTSDSPVPVTDKDKNVRTVGIADGGLYVTSDKTATLGLSRVSSTLPTAAIGTTVTPLADTNADFPKATPNGFVLLDADASVPGPDVAYVVIEKSGIAKYALVGGTWTYEGLIVSPDPAAIGKPATEALAGRVQADGSVVLYTIDSVTANNHVVQLVDSASAASAPDITLDRVAATATDGRAFHGVTIAPLNWAPKTSGGTPTTTLTVTPLQSGLGLALGDASEPTTVPVTVSASDGDVSGVSVTASVTSPGAASAASVTAGSAPGSYVVHVAPGAAIGYSSVVVTATRNGAVAGTTTIRVGQSGEATALPGSSYLLGAADASSAIDVGDGYAIVADDETNTLRLYDETSTGRPVKTWNFNTVGGFGGEGDLEASARVGDTIYWVGSGSNKKTGAADPDRDILFTTKVTGTGAATELSYGGKYQGLKEDLVAWDVANGNPLGLASVCAAGVLPDNEASCNVEGFETAPGDGSVGYVGFRAPSVGGKAVIVPILNLPGLIDAKAGTAKFGAPILLDLGGRTIRELRKNDQGQYLITAGVPDDADQSLGWALYRWNGLPTSAPVLVRTLPTTTDASTASGSGTGVAGQEVGSWETILSVPNLDAPGATVRLVTDNGTTAFYGDDTAGKDQPEGLQKDRATSFALPKTSDPLPAANVELDASSVAPGDSLHVKAHGFAPGEAVTITLHSTPTTLKTITATGTGALDATVTVPTSAPAGAHTIVVSGASGVSGSAPLTVTGAAGAASGGGAGAVPGSASDPTDLASTGSDTWLPLGLAASLLLAGALAWTARAVARRRHTR